MQRECDNGRSAGSSHAPPASEVTRDMPVEVLVVLVAELALGTGRVSAPQASRSAPPLCDHVGVGVGDLNRQQMSDGLEDVQAPVGAPGG